MDDWGFEQLEPWVTARQVMPVGPLFCVINGRTCGRAWPASAARAALRSRAMRAGVRRRFVPHQLRHAHAIELAREGVPLNVIQRQLGHRNLGVTSIYLQGIDPGEIIETVRARRPPMIPASAGLVLPIAGWRRFDAAAAGRYSTAAAAFVDFQHSAGERSCCSFPAERRYAEAQPRDRRVRPLCLFGCLFGPCRRGLPKEFYEPSRQPGP
jgi:hypothetical protein